MTDFEHSALLALVVKYGPEYIIETVQDIGFGIAEDEYNEVVKKETKEPERS